MRIGCLVPCLIASLKEVPAQRRLPFFIEGRALRGKAPPWNCLRRWVANASAPYRGQNRQNREKRVSGSKNSHFPVPQKWALWVKKSPFSLWRSVEKWGFFDSKHPFLGHWEMGVFWPRNPLFPISAILTPVGGRRVRKWWATTEAESLVFDFLISCTQGPPQFLKKTLREWRGQWKSFMWVPIISGNRSGSCSENCGFRIAQVVGCHSENGISNSESCSENAPELSESSENGLFPPRPFSWNWGGPQASDDRSSETGGVSLSWVIFKHFISWFSWLSLFAQNTIGLLQYFNGGACLKKVITQSRGFSCFKRRKNLERVTFWAPRCHSSFRSQSPGKFPNQSPKSGFAKGVGRKGFPWFVLICSENKSE